MPATMHASTEAPLRRMATCISDVIAFIITWATAAVAAARGTMAACRSSEIDRNESIVMWTVIIRAYVPFDSLTDDFLPLIVHAVSSHSARRPS